MIEKYATIAVLRMVKAILDEAIDVERIKGVNFELITMLFQIFSHHCKEGAWQVLLQRSVEAKRALFPERMWALFEYCRIHGKSIDHLITI